MKPQDVVVLLKLQAHPDLRFIRDLADSIGFDVAGTHRSLQRLRAAGLFDVPGAGMVPLGATGEFLISAVKYVFPAVRGGDARGVPTSWAADPLSGALSSRCCPPPVWPDAAGAVDGVALEPLHPMVPAAALADDRLARRLVLVDALRDRLTGRDRTTAAGLLRASLRA